MARRANGEGTIGRRKDGRFEARLYASSPDGRTKRVVVYARTRSEIYRKLRAAQQKVEQGMPLSEVPYLNDYIDYWLDEIVHPNLRPATYQKYRTICGLYLKSGLGTVKLDKLTAPMVQSYLNGLQRDGLSIANVHEVRKILSSVLTRAMKQELISRNVARLVDLPAHTSPEIKPWSAAEVARFIDSTRSEPLFPAFMLQLLYGLRRGEVLGLRWQDVNFKEEVLSIRQQLQRISGALLLGPTKTKMSARDLRLGADAAAALSAHLEAQTILKVQLGPLWPWQHDEDELVFTTAMGLPIDPQNYSRSFHQACARHGLRRIRVHDMRHTFATLASQGSALLQDIQFTLGHTKISTTAEIYHHGSIESSGRVLRQMNELITAERRIDTTASTESRVESPLQSRIPAQVSGGCRQLSRQSHVVDDFFTTFISGAGEETLTLDLFLGNSHKSWCSMSVTGVAGAQRTRWKCRLVGFVVVNLVVKASRGTTLGKIVVWKAVLIAIN